MVEWTDESLLRLLVEIRDAGLLAICPTCSAWVQDLDRHASWHERIVAAANRYVPPPVYRGGGV